MRKRRLDTRWVFGFVSCLKSKAGSYRKVLSELDLLSLGFTAPAISSVYEARKKVGWVFFSKLITFLYFLVRERLGRQYCWKGHLVYAIDGSKINLPLALKKSKYPIPLQGQRPQGLLTCLYDASACLPVHVTVSRHHNEIATVEAHLKVLKKGSIVVYDRNFLCDLEEKTLSFSLQQRF